MKSPIFIVGPHRSGSTLWHNLVAMCPGVMRLTDPRFLGDGWHKDFSYFLRTQVHGLATDADVDRMVDLCLSRKPVPGLSGTLWEFDKLDIVNDPALSKEIKRRVKQSDRSLGAIARIFVEELTRFGGYERACVKFPVDVRHMGRLLEWFPDGKVIHITRDPRAMAMSKSNDPYGTVLRVLEHPRLAWFIRKFMSWRVASQYRLTARLHEKFKNSSNYKLFCYEDLLANPEGVLRDLCQFIGEDFNPDMLAPEKGKHQHQASSLTGKQQKEFDPAAAIRWRTKISPFGNWAITAMTRSSMKRFGYDPETHPIFRMDGRRLVGAASQPASQPVSS
jgi:hypothetical protein